MINLKKAIKAYVPGEAIEVSVDTNGLSFQDTPSLRVERRGFSLGIDTPPINVRIEDGTFSLDTPGFYEISLIHRGYSLERKGLVVLPEKPIEQSKRMGIGIYGKRHSNEFFTEMVRLAQYIGAGTAREEFNWAEVEPERSEYRWGGPDYRVDTYFQYGIDVLGLIAYSSPWASKVTEGQQPRDCYPPVQTEYYTNYATTLLQRYWPKVRHWEIWNEPDWHLPNDVTNFFTGTTEEYAKLLEASHDRLKEINSNVDVHIGGLGLLGLDKDFVAQCIEISGRVCFDTLNLHGYATWENMRNQIDTVKKHKDSFEVWLGEVGMHSTVNGNTPKDKAGFLVSKLAESIFHGIDRFIWYNFRNDGCNEHDVEHNYGLITHDGYACPALMTYATCSSLLGGANPVDRWLFRNGLECMVFDNEREWVFLLMGENHGGDFLKIRNTTLVDPYGVQRKIGYESINYFLSHSPIFALGSKRQCARTAFESIVDRPWT